LRLDAKDIHKEMFPLCGEKCLSLKAVHNWVEKSGNRFVDDEKVETEVDFHAADFDALVKRWDKYISVDGGFVEKWMFLQVRISHVLCFISMCDIFTDSPSYYPVWF
jgi:hypothetical protein